MTEHAEQPNTERPAEPNTGAGLWFTLTELAKRAKRSTRNAAREAGAATKAEADESMLPLALDQPAATDAAEHKGILHDRKGD